MSEIQSYIDLKVNGKLFPLWIMQNFKKYKLEPFDKGANESNITIENIRNEILKLAKYQAFISSIMSYKSEIKSILVYHGLGSGKTGSAINFYNVIYNFNPAQNVFLLIKASLHDNPWLQGLQKFLPKHDYDQRMSQIKFVHYDAWNADKLFLTAVKESDSSKQNIYIIDEAHNFIRNVYSNVTTKTGKRALTIYDYIIQEKKANASTRILLLSATPAVNQPFELALMFNLLRPDIFPNTETKFEEIYVNKDENNNSILNPKTKNMFQRRILGLVSYYIGADPSKFAQTETRVKQIIMSEYQKDVYKHFEHKEEQMEKQSSNSTVYRTYTRQASNFVFPVMGELNGENRPRPSKFKISEKEAEDIIRGRMDKYLDSNKKDMDIESVRKNFDMYIMAVNKYIESFKSYLNDMASDDDKSGYTLEKDIEEFKTTYNYSFGKFWAKHNTKSKLLQTLYNCSCKYTVAMFTIMKSKGPLYLFSNFVKMEGLEVLKIYLEIFGYKNYRDKSGKPGFCYSEYHGDIDKKERSDNIKTFNNINNIKGDVIKIMLIAPAGSEGLNLKFIRMIIILDPYWTEVRILQLIGRGVRYDSHLDLPLEDRNVIIYRFHAILPPTIKRNKLSTDEDIYRIATMKDKSLLSFINPMKEAAIDCELFAAQNMVKEKYSCFKFNESSYFNKISGPAYKEDIFYDSKINDGSNSLNSVKKDVKVYKIVGQIKISDEEYIDKKNYWYCPKSSVVYDYDLDFPIGKVLKQDGIPVKINDVYIIDTVIDIPKLTRVM